MSDNLVNFIIPAYNVENFIKVCLDSVVNQTFKGWEAIIIDDGSDDDTYNIIKSYKEPRFKIVKNARNLGLAGVRNLGLSLTNAKYIAWLDSDDFAHHHRLEIQLNFLKHNSEINLCGSWIQTFGFENNTIKYLKTDQQIRDEFIFSDPLATSSIIMEHRLFKENGICFDSNFAPAEDYDAWERLLPFARMGNIPKVLCYYRIHQNNSSTLQKQKQIDAVKGVQSRQLLRIGISIEDIDWNSHFLIGVELGKITSEEDFKNLLTWIERILSSTASKDLKILTQKKALIVLLNMNLKLFKKISYINFIFSDNFFLNFKYIILSILHYLRNNLKFKLTLN